MVSPFCRTHFCSVLVGKLMTEEGSGGAALRLTMLNNKPAQRNFATRELKNVILSEAKNL